MSEDVEYLVEDGVAYLWLNRPHLKNSITWDMLSRIGECIALAEKDDSVKAIVMRGRGGTLSTGSDLGGIQDNFLSRPRAPLELVTKTAKVWRALQDSTKPTIAVVEGYCIAGGFELMISCDFAIASDDAKIGDFHIKRGVTGGGAPIYRLPRIVGIRRAKELMLTGKIISGRQAAEWNLVNLSVPAAELDQAVQDFIAPFRDLSSYILWITKQTVNCGLDADQNTLTVLEHYSTACVLQSNDAAEAVQAYLEKRKPEWSNS